MLSRALLPHRVLLVFLLCLPIVAAAQGAKTKEIAAPLSRILGLAQALTQLDAGQDRVVKDGPREHTIKEPYKFGPGFRIAMARNLTALKPLIEGYEKEIAALRSEIVGTKAIKDDAPELARLNEENRKLLAMPQKANLYVILESELKLEVNTIPIAMLSNLEIILEYDK